MEESLIHVDVKIVVILNNSVQLILIFDLDSFKL